VALGYGGGGYEHSDGMSLRCSIRGGKGSLAEPWPLVKTERQVTETTAAGQGLELVVCLPLVFAGVGRLELRCHGREIGDIDFMLCAVDQCGIIEHVRVDPPHRRLGLGRILVAAAR